LNVPVSTPARDLHLEPVQPFGGALVFSGRVPLSLSLTLP
jgi:hypothetical protein